MLPTVGNVVLQKSASYLAGGIKLVGGP